MPWDDALVWFEAKPSDKLTLLITTPADGDFGIFCTALNGTMIGNLVEGYNNNVCPIDPVFFQTVVLKKGVNQLTIEIIGKDGRATGYSKGHLVGIDGFGLIKE